MLNITAKNGKRIVKIDPQKYAGLLTEILPIIIETEAQNKRMIKVLNKIDKIENPSPEEIQIMKLLAHLIQDFEQRFYKPERPTPHDALIGLMEMNNLKQVDLIPIFGSRGIISEVINGKRELSKTHIKALAEFFHVSVDLFI